MGKRMSLTASNFHERIHRTVYGEVKPVSFGAVEGAS
jgi:hypothetical protein